MKAVRMNAVHSAAARPLPAPAPRWRHAAAPLLCGLLLAAAAAQARPADPLFRKAQQIMGANQGLVANGMSNAFVIDGNGASLAGSFKTLLDGWVNGEPVRSLTEKNPNSEKAYSMAHMELFLGAAFADHPDDFFNGAGEASRAPNQSLKGKQAAVLNIRAGASKTQPGYLATVWLDADSGAPLKANVTWLNVKQPGVRTVHAVITYETDDNGRTLPKEIAGDYKIAQKPPTQVSFRKYITSWSKAN